VERIVDTERSLARTLLSMQQVQGEIISVKADLNAVFNNLTPKTLEISNKVKVFQTEADARIASLERSIVLINDEIIPSFHRKEQHLFTALEDVQAAVDADKQEVSAGSGVVDAVKEQLEELVQHVDEIEVDFEAMKETVVELCLSKAENKEVSVPMDTDMQLIKEALREFETTKNACTHHADQIMLLHQHISQLQQQISPSRTSFSTAFSAGAPYNSGITGKTIGVGVGAGAAARARALAAATSSKEDELGTVIPSVLDTVNLPSMHPQSSQAEEDERSQVGWNENDDLSNDDDGDNHGECALPVTGLWLAYNTTEKNVETELEVEIDPEMDQYPDPSFLIHNDSSIICDDNTVSSANSAHSENELRDVLEISNRHLALMQSVRNSNSGEKRSLGTPNDALSVGVSISYLSNSALEGEAEEEASIDDTFISSDSGSDVDEIKVHRALKYGGSDVSSPQTSGVRDEPLTRGTRASGDNGDSKFGLSSIRALGKKAIEKEQKQDSNLPPSLASVTSVSIANSATVTKSFSLGSSRGLAQFIIDSSSAAKTVAGTDEKSDSRGRVSVRRSYPSAMSPMASPQPASKLTRKLTELSPTRIPRYISPAKSTSLPESSKLANDASSIAAHEHIQRLDNLLGINLLKRNRAVEHVIPSPSTLATSPPKTNSKNTSSVTPPRTACKDGDTDVSSPGNVDNFNDEDDDDEEEDFNYIGTNLVHFGSHGHTPSLSRGSS
jgi:hypothetical protein